MPKISTDEIESLWAKACKLDADPELKARVAEFIIPILFRWLAEDRNTLSEISRNLKETEELEKRIIVLEAQEKFDAQFTTKEKSPPV